MEQEASVMSNSNRQQPITFEDELQNLQEGSSVAVLTLLGSLCPITLAHVQAFHEARHLILATPNQHDPSLRPADLPAFDRVVGFVSVNADSYVARKFPNGLPVRYDQRVALVEMAIADIPWMGVEDSEGETHLYLKYKYPHLNFIHFTINGADDVVKYRKWREALKLTNNKQHKSVSPDSNRFITMGRAGQTRLVLEGMERSGVGISQFFFLGPELPDISSTMVREALKQGDRESLRAMLHPRVMDWCLAKRHWFNKERDNALS